MFDDNAFILSEFEEYLKRRGKKPGTIYVQMNVIKSFMKKGYDITKYEHYNIYLEEHSIKKRSVYYYDVLGMFVKWKFKDQKELQKLLLDAIHMTGYKIKDPVKQTLFLSEPQMMSIIKTLENPKHALIAWIQKETGVRAGDVIRLKRDNIKFVYHKDDNDISLEVTFVKKADKISKVPIFNPYLVEYIKERLIEIDGEENFVFIDRNFVNKENSDNEFKLERRNYRLYWEDLRKTTELLGFDSSKFSTHDWRRNFANRVWIDILDKKDILGLQRAMDHVNVDTTARYLRQSGLDTRDIFKKSYDLSKE